MNLFNNCLFTVFAFSDLLKADLIEDVLAPSFALAMIVGYIVTKIFPPENTERDINTQYNKL